MKDLIWGIIGVIIAVCGAAYMFSLIRLKNKGQLVLAEIISVREKKRNAYVHTLRFTVGDVVYEKEDRSGFNQPFKIGEKQLVFVDSVKPERFEYETEVKKNIVIAGVMIAAALAFSVRWLLMWMF